ncbi:MAG: hypothetical protein U0Q16_19455 [Bryobacteraceae bacterium]
MPLKILPVHCAPVGCTTVGQIEDDVRVVREFRQLDAEQMSAMRKRAENIAGYMLEDWKRRPATAQASTYVGG